MKILIAVEDKLFGEAIAQFVVRNNWSRNTAIKIIHVIEPLHVDVLSGYNSEDLRVLHDRRLHAARALLSLVSAQLKTNLPNVAIEQEIIEGSPKDAIINCAIKWPADLIVLGSHGRSGIGQFFMGSVSMSVMSASPCSLMIVKLPHS